VRRRERLIWIGVVSALLIAAGGLAAWMLRPASIPPETRLDVTTPATSDPVSFALSPDGRHIVFLATANGQSQLWVRSLDGAVLRLLPGTGGARYPFWKPDSQSIGFVADGQIKTIEINGGAPHVLTTSGNGRGAAWGVDGTILFTLNAVSGIFRISASGGDRKAVTTLLPGQTGHRFPQWLPGTGRRFLYYATGTTDTRGVYLASLDGSPDMRLSDADAAAAYLAPGWLLLVQQGALRARRFDVVRGWLSDDSITVADGVTTDPVNLTAAVSVSSNGLVGYRTGAGVRRQLTWFNRKGDSLGRLGAPDDSLLAPDVSPDGQRVAVGRTELGKGDVWIYEASRTVKFTLGPESASAPLWSHDGKRILFRATTASGGLALYEKLVGGGGLPVPFPELGPNLRIPGYYDDHYVLYTVSDPKTSADIWALPLNGASKPFPFLHEAYDERNGQISPDGRWIAYQSNESTRFEIYIRPFPAAPGQWPVSTAGGVQPRWRADSKELYFVAPDGQLMVAPIVVNGAAIQTVVPVALFRSRMLYGGTDTVGRAQYAVAGDGRFLINVALDDETASPITIIQNWRAGK
jgi:Tol biopolymer transport system component